MIAWQREGPAGLGAAWGKERILVCPHARMPHEVVELPCLRFRVRRARKEGTQGGHARRARKEGTQGGHARKARKEGTG